MWKFGIKNFDFSSCYTIGTIGGCEEITLHKEYVAYIIYSYLSK